MTRGPLLNGYPVRYGILTILMLTAATYAVSLANGFVWDDKIYLLANKVYTEINLREIIFSSDSALEYLPFPSMMSLFDMYLWGTNAVGFHLTNILFYLATLAVFYHLLVNLQQLTGRDDVGFMSFWSTLIFALHPLHTEVINWISARNHLLATFFLFLSLDLVVYWIRTKKGSSLLLSMLFFIGAVFSKQTAIFYPLFLVLLFCVIPSSKLSSRWKAGVLVFFFLLDVLAVFTHLGKARTSDVMNDNLIGFGSSSLLMGVVKAVQIPVYYLKMLVVPYPLSVSYSAPFDSGHYIVKALLACGLLSLLVFGVLALRKKNPMIYIGSAWFLTSLIPVLNLFPTLPVVCDRYTYPAVAGFAIVLASLLEKAFRRWKGSLILSLIVIVLWICMDFTRSLDWRSDISLWRAALNVDEQTDRNNLAEALWEDGQFDQALTLLRDEGEKRSSYNYHYFLARYYLENGRPGDAVPELRYALRQGGDIFKKTHLLLAQAYEETGSAGEALQEYLRAGETREHDPLGRQDALARDGAVRTRKTFSAELEKLRQQAALNPADFDLQMRTAILLHEVGLYEDSVRYYKLALSVDPYKWEAWYNIALALEKAGNLNEAVKSIDRSIELNPNNKNAYNTAGSYRVLLHDYRGAAAYFNKSLAVDPSFVFPAFNLGKLYFTIGDRNMALKYFNTAKSLARGDEALEKRSGRYLDLLEK